MIKKLVLPEEKEVGEIVSLGDFGRYKIVKIEFTGKRDFHKNRKLYRHVLEKDK